MPLTGVLVAVIAAASTPAPAQVRFTEVGADRGIQAYEAGPGYGTGAAAADYDGDGDVDLFVANGPGAPDQLYRNIGDGHFEEIAHDLGLASTQATRAALWVDFDADGRLDLVTTGDCFDDAKACAKATLHFYRQRKDGGFDDVTAVMAPDDDLIDDFGQHRGGPVAGDVSGDGWPDLVMGVWRGSALILINQGGTGFVDIGPDCGIAGADFHHWQPALHDFDGDGGQDIYWATDFTANRLWLNGRDGSFVDIAPAAGVDNAMNDMGLVVGDYDNDGDADLYVTEIYEFDNHNVLYRNDSTADEIRFTEVAVDAGVENTGFGWGTTFLDADNDGWLDLIATNGWFNGIGFDDPSRFFYNLGTDPVRFEERGALVGFDDIEWGASLIAFDADRDGDLDVVQTCNLDGPLRLLDNEPDAKRHFLVVRPRMDGPNTHALGAVVRAETGERTMTRFIAAGVSHLGQEPAEAFFGLGDAATVDRLLIEWPDGAQTIRTDVAADEVITIRRSACAGTADLDGDGAIGSTDLGLLLDAWGPCPRRCPHDLDGNGVVDVADLVALLGAWGPCP
jgi:hypothetical protein